MSTNMMKGETKMNCAKNIKDAREYRGMTQLELSEKIGISRASLAQIEAGLKVLTVPMAQAIAEALDLPVMVLIEGFKHLDK
jgi:transcriptional regulator with XRE-family HTH domain